MRTGFIACSGAESPCGSHQPAARRENLSISEASTFAEEKLLQIRICSILEGTVRCKRGKAPAREHRNTRCMLGVMIFCKTGGGNTVLIYELHPTSMFQWFAAKYTYER